MDAGYTIHPSINTPFLQVHLSVHFPYIPSHIKAPDYLFVHQSIHPPNHPLIYQSILLPIYPSIHNSSINSPSHPPHYISIHPPIPLSIHLHIQLLLHSFLPQLLISYHPARYLTISLFIHLSPNPITHKIIHLFINISIYQSPPIHFSVYVLPIN